LFEGFIVSIIILSVGVCPAAADFGYVLKRTRDLIEGAMSSFFSPLYIFREEEAAITWYIVFL
jgi:hypothetical protein